MIQFNDLEKDIRFIDYSETIQRVMASYHLSDEQVDELLNPTNKIVKGDALIEIEAFFKNANKLIICGDYDADGVTSTAIAIRLAQSIGLDKPGFYIPNRFTEGYGVSMNTIKRAHERGYTDLLLVDNGVKAQEEITYAKELGFNVAVVDHHIVEKPLKDCVFVHPEVLDSYGAQMCGAGLMVVIAESMGVLDDVMLAYGAVGTLADVMPLWHKNREIVRRGVEIMNTKRIKALDLLTGSKVLDTYTAQDIAFKIVPKINSVGRMADIVNMNTMVEYLISEDDKVLTSYSKQVLELNTFRKNKGKSNYELAQRMIRDDSILILSHPDFHEGILGIVANQLVQALNKPAILLKETEYGFKGSARSNTVSLQDLFARLNPDYFEAFGGHDFAYGMTIKLESMEDFREDVLLLGETLPVIKRNVLSIKVDFPLSKMFFNELSEFEPFGTGFSLPLFSIDFPSIYQVYSLNGYGYKFAFTDFWLKNAVYFNTNVSKEILSGIKEATGTFTMNEKYGLSFNIDKIKI